MNTGMNLLLMVSLLLALVLAGDAGKEQVKTNSEATQMRPSRIAINHNETLVRDITR
ncbi:MAG TPA: hypothetical protein VKB46_28780 [Pyrinomonadaceae bacterium]|nr:hypothetical protein [Pyrinomonadaceae bacterium]